jgi:hypothetical protein
LEAKGIEVCHKAMGKGRINAKAQLGPLDDTYTIISLIAHPKKFTVFRIAGIELFRRGMDIERIRKA